MKGPALFAIMIVALVVGGGLSWLVSWVEDRRRDKHFRNPKTGRFYKDE